MGAMLVGVLIAVLIVAPWLVIAVAPVVLLVASVSYVTTRGGRTGWRAVRAWRARAAERLAEEEAPVVEVVRPIGARTSFVNGLSGLDVEAMVKRALDTIVAGAGSCQGECTTACSCVRRENGGYLGVVRIDAPSAHYLAQVRGKTRQNVALRIVHECELWDGVSRCTPDLVETIECNHAQCPPGGWLSLPPPLAA